MNALVFQLLTVLVTVGGPAAPENALLNELVEKGVHMPDGQVLRLPPPTMAEGLNAQQQAAVLAATAPRGKVEEFLDKASGAPVSLKVGKIPSKMGDDVIRTVNLSFVVYGDWNVLTSDQFSKTILKEGKANNGKQQGMVSKAGYLKPPDLAVRGLATRSTPNVKEYFLYTTLRLFDRVELSVTRFGVATKTPAGVIVAAKLDPRFAKDKEYPNLWREIDKDTLGNEVLGLPQSYSGGGFYAKVTRLIKPANAIFVEFHQLFYEPRAWFGEDENLTRAELGKIIPFEVKQFRGKLARATKDAEK
ncbi:MAG: hypothetical protein ABSG53_13635 [Thermoguttaceae bacterium]|jgi:hypothetical protein